MGNLPPLRVKTPKPHSFVGTYPLSVVTEVKDGDTVVVAFRFRGVVGVLPVRISGIDCPEIHTKNLLEKKAGLRAKEILERALLGKRCTLTVVGTEKFGRLLGRIKIWRKDVGQRLLDLGVAREHNGEAKVPWNENVLKVIAETDTSSF